MRRRRVPEVMDEPELPAALHRAALAGLARLHAVSRTECALWRTVRAGVATDRVRLLDLACGRGDLLRRLAARARRAGIALTGLGLDRSPLAIAEARRYAADVPRLRFEVADVLTDGLPAGYDCVVSSLFLHHLDESQAVALLARMRRVAGQLVAVEDLVRSRAGLVLAWVGSRLLTRSPVVRADALRSVRAAFRPDEMLRLAERAGWQQPLLRRHWPQRLLLWERL